MAPDRIESDLYRGVKRLLSVPYTRRGPFKLPDKELRAWITAYEARWPQHKGGQE